MVVPRPGSIGGSNSNQPPRGRGGTCREEHHVIADHPDSTICGDEREGVDQSSLLRRRRHGTPGTGGSSSEMRISGSASGETPDAVRLQPNESGDEERAREDERRRDRAQHGEINDDHCGNADRDGEQQQGQFESEQLAGRAQRGDALQHGLARARLLE
ncbi:hypothetical protein FQA39_LY19209 [Lamprigera yunnana]|nr:hypothetical protein FQA39_LY19209 [Lamprigera yunnana]